MDSTAGNGSNGPDAFTGFHSGCGTSPTPSNQQPDVDGELIAIQYADSVLVSASSSPTLSPSKDDPFFVADACAKEVFGANGGKLKIQLDNKELFFVIPKGALAGEVEIEICGWKFATSERDVFIYECKPSGLEFSVPMWIDHPVKSQDGEYAVMFYNGEKTHTWLLEQISPVSKGTTKFEIHHFSKYGVSD